jgi:hypothetical protein
VAYAKARVRPEARRRERKAVRAKKGGWALQKGTYEAELGGVSEALNIFARHALTPLPIAKTTTYP